MEFHRGAIGGHRSTAGQSGVSPARDARDGGDVSHSRDLPTADPFLVTKRGAGALTHAETRHARFLLTSRGVRLPAAAEGEFARWAAAHLPLRPESVLSHTTATRLLGLPLPMSLEAMPLSHVTTPREIPRPRRRDIVTHHAQLPAEDVMTMWGLRLTTPERTFVDMASLLSFDYLVALGDAVLRLHHREPHRLLEVADRRLRYPGRGRARSAVTWLDARAESPRESLLRVMLRRAGLPRPEVNGVIRDAHGYFVARGDLVFRRERVVVEYDGEVHAPMDQRAKDADRRARLRAAGWIVVEIVGQDMHRSDRVIARVRSALADGRSRAS